MCLLFSFLPLVDCMGEILRRELEGPCEGTDAPFCFLLGGKKSFMQVDKHFLVDNVYLRDMWVKACAPCCGVVLLIGKSMGTSLD